MTDETKTEAFTTNCAKCVFAQYSISDKQQIGCDLGRLEKYKNQNRAVLNDAGFYTISTVCNTCRGETWLKAQSLSSDPVAIVEDEIKMDLAFVIYSFNDDPVDLTHFLELRINECIKQVRIKPSQIIVVIKSLTASSHDVHQLLLEMCDGIPFLVVRILDQSSDLDRCLDLAIQKVDSKYYFVTNIHYPIPNNMIQEINSLINDHLKSVSMIEPAHKQHVGLVLQTALHRIFGGNRVSPIYEKIKQAAALQDKSDNIHTWEALWSYQK